MPFETNDHDGAADAPPANPNIRLLSAALSNRLEKARAAIDDGADVNWVSAIGYSPLSAAVQHGNRAIVETLLEHGARFPDETVGGRTLWVEARSRGYEEVASVLRRRGVHPHASDHVTAFIDRWRRRRERP